MNLQELNKLIHSATKEELQTNLSTWKSQINTILLAGTEADEHYFINHTGRELFRKLYNFDLELEIKDEYDSGFRPQRKSKLNALDITIRAHLDATVSNSISESSGSVSEWRDISGNNFHASTSTANQMPSTNSRTLNGLNVIDFDGVDNFLTFSSKDVISFGYTTVFIVYKSDAANKDYILGSGNENPNKSRFYLRSDSSIIGSFDSAQNDKINFLSQNDTDERISMQETVLGTTKRNLGTFLYRDGVFQGSKPDVAYVHEITSTQPNNEDMLKLQLGSREGNVNNHEGYIAEVLFLNNEGEQLTQETRENIEAYLAYKWGLVSKLDIAHPYKNSLYKTFNT